MEIFNSVLSFLSYFDYLNNYLKLPSLHPSLTLLIHEVNKSVSSTFLTFVEAANILQELQVETYGSMEKREKVEYILEQMRLCLAKKDYIRTQIISKKISVKFFESDKEQV